MKNDFNLTRLEGFEEYIGTKTVGAEDIYE